MFHWQQPEWLSLITLDTDDGQLLADGSTMTAGIHLRWDFQAVVSTSSAVSTDQEQKHAPCFFPSEREYRPDRFG
jgi:hypothetical protein